MIGFDLCLTFHRSLTIHRSNPILLDWLILLFNLDTETDEDMLMKIVERKSCVLMPHTHAKKTGAKCFQHYKYSFCDCQLFTF